MDIKEEKITKILKSGVIFLIALRFVLAIIYPVFSDATQYFYISKHISLLFNPNFNYYPPLEFILGAFLYQILGEIGLKLIAPTFGGIAIYYTYKLGKEIFDEKRGLIAAIILGIIPSHIYLSSMGYQDAIVTGMSVVFIYYFYKSITTKKETIKAGISAGLTSLSKLTGVIVFPIIGLYYLAITLKKRFLDLNLLKKCLIMALIGLIISSPYYTRTLLLFGQLFGFQVIPPKFESFSLTSNFESSYFNTPFTSRLAVYREATIFDYLKEIYLDFWGIPFGAQISSIPAFVITLFFIATLIMSFIFIYGIVKGFKQKDNENIFLIYIWLMAWIIAILILQKQLMWGFRRLLPIAPIIALLAARGFTFHSEKFKKIFYLILILAVIAFPASQIAKAWYAHNYFNMYADSLQYIKSLPKDTVVLIHDDEQAIYYTEKKAYNIGHLNPKYFNLTTLKKYNITHIVRFEHYLFYDLREHNKIIDIMEKNKELELVWESKYVRIYKVNYNY